MQTKCNETEALGRKWCVVGPSGTEEVAGTTVLMLHFWICSPLNFKLQTSPFNVRKINFSQLCGCCFPRCKWQSRVEFAVKARPMLRKVVEVERGENKMIISAHMKQEELHATAERQESLVQNPKITCSWPVSEGSRLIWKSCKTKRNFSSQNFGIKMRCRWNIGFTHSQQPRRASFAVKLSQTANILL